MYRAGSPDIQDLVLIEDFNWDEFCPNYTRDSWYVESVGLEN